MKSGHAKAGRVFIGTSGWNYRHWADGVFYPADCKPPEWLAFYSAVFDAVEVNNTFYQLPPPKVFRAWHDATPQGFSFAVKASRFITHMKKLTEPERHVARFLSHAAELRKKLGAVLFQLPPFWKFNAGRLEGLLAFMETQAIVPRVKTALEVRHPSWLCDECHAILRHHGTALVFHDHAICPVAGPVTADFIYIRRHGPGSYKDAAIRRDAERIRSWLAEGRDVRVYFNNDAEGHAVRDARRLSGRLGKGSVEMLDVRTTKRVSPGPSHQ